jgi:3-oxoacyl-[acyl-carrier protein] reductase
MSLEGRIALVSGAGRGIGRAIAAGLARDGADIAVNYRRDGKAAAEVVQKIQALGRKAQAFRASVDSLDDVTKMVA